MKDKILTFADKNKHFKTKDIVNTFNISRQFASLKLNQLVKEGLLIKSGSTKSSIYCLPKYSKTILNRITKRLHNQDLDENEIMISLKKKSEVLSSLKKNIFDIFEYAFSEILNNAIEHSGSTSIQLDIWQEKNTLTFTINDTGIGIFNNIMDKFKLNTPYEAITDLLKGKTTTKPENHSGQGIFFTSKVSDVFTIESSSHRFIVQNEIDDIFIEKLKRKKNGTKVKFSININSNKKLIDIFKKFQTSTDDLAFDKTEIKIKLFTIGETYIPRSQARRVVAGLDKFRSIIFDFDKVSMVGQGFADEIFRVFQNKHPNIKLTPINMNDNVEFMVGRV